MFAWDLDKDTHYEFRKYLNTIISLRKISKNISKIILYARETVLDFYKNLGFNIVEKAHSLENVQHFLMERKNN